MVGLAERWAGGFGGDRGKAFMENNIRREFFFHLAFAFDIISTAARPRVTPAPGSSPNQVSNRHKSKPVKMVGCGAWWCESARARAGPARAHGVSVFDLIFFQKYSPPGPLAPADVRPDAAALQRFNVSSAFPSMAKGDLA